jgi:outer membrane lipoprotein-sorting protein
MIKKKSTIIPVIALIPVLVMVFTPCYSADSDVAEIVMSVEKNLSLEDIQSEQKMTVYRKDGSVRPYSMKVLTQGKEKTFAEILSPPREKGRQMLKLGDVVWSYLPSVKKSIRVSGRGSFMGGDFENNDVLRLNLVGDYTAKIIEELPDQYILELKGKDLSLSYAKIKLWVRKDDYQAIKQEYYTLSDKLIKSTKYEKIKDFGGHSRPSVLIMQSALNPKQKTILEIVEFKLKVKNPSKIFRRSNLGK